MIIENIHIRAATINDIPALAQVHVDSWRTTYKGIVSQNYLDTLSYNTYCTMWKEIFGINDATSVRLVAVDEYDRVIGFIAGGKTRNPELGFDAELYALYLLSIYQRKGIGKELMHYFVQQLMKHNFHAMHTWVFARNPSTKFYEKIHGELLSVTKMVDFDGQQFIEVAYGWKNLKNLEL